MAPCPASPLTLFLFFEYTPFILSTTTISQQLRHCVMSFAQRRLTCPRSVTYFFSCPKLHYYFVLFLLTLAAPRVLFIYGLFSISFTGMQFPWEQRSEIWAHCLNPFWVTLTKHSRRSLFSHHSGSREIQDQGAGVCRSVETFLLHSHVAEAEMQRR